MVSEEKIFRNRPIRNKNCLWWPCLSTDQDEMCNLHRGLFIDASYHVSVHLAKRFQRRRFFFRNQPIRNKNCLWWPCLLMDRDVITNMYQGHSIDASYQVSGHLAKRFQRRLLEIDQSETRIVCGGHVYYRIAMRNFVRGPSIDASYQVTVHLVKRFQRRSFLINQPIRNKNCPWWPCLSTDRDEMSNPYREHPIDASYIVSVHLSKQFQRRRFKKIGQFETTIVCCGNVC